MKTNYLTMLIFIVFMSISCKKETVTSFDELSLLTREVINKPTLVELKQGQGMLSTAEREQLWRTKLNFILTNKNEIFTVDQRKIVLMLKDILMQNGIAGLLKNPAISNEFMLKNLPYFEKHFSKEQLNLLIESPYLKSTMLISKITMSDMEALESRLLAPKPCTCKYDLGCHGAGNDCNVGGCETRDEVEMCGLFGTEHCLNRCEGIQPDL